MMLTGYKISLRDCWQRISILIRQLYDLGTLWCGGPNAKSSDGIYGIACCLWDAYCLTCSKQEAGQHTDR